MSYFGVSNEPTSTTKTYDLSSTPCVQAPSASSRRSAIRLPKLVEHSLALPLLVVQRILTLFGYVQTTSTNASKHVTKGSWHITRVLIDIFTVSDRRRCRIVEVSAKAEGAYN